jgi:signal transduction histidine kinase
VFGNIYLTDKRSSEAFDEEDERILVVLATQAAIAVENARLAEETERRGRELQRLQVFEERERIGKELHDGVIQSLFALGMNLQAMATASEDHDLVRRLETAVQDVDHAIRDLRNYIFGLRPGILADRQLDQALRELCSEFERTSAVVIVAEIDLAVAAELSPLAADVVQLTRESLSNVSRHADAATCRVVLRRDGAAAILEVDDDGRGYDTSSTTGGMGLANLRNRVEAIGGTFETRSVPGNGTTVTVRLPV